MVMPTKVLFVNSYMRSGIGDFGQEIRRQITKNAKHELMYIETSETWRSFFYVWRCVILFKGKVLLNLGFTVFGKSIFRNLLNFFLIFLVSVFSPRKISAVLHDSPEITDSENSGYENFRLINAGSRIATEFLRHTKLVVLSVELYKVLTVKHKLKRVRFQPFPCSRIPTKKTSNFAKPVLILHVGYISKYKGLEILPDLKRALKNKVEIAVIGGIHAVLSRTPIGASYLEKLRSDLGNADIKVPGYLSESEIQKIMARNRCIGILPYRMTSGSSYSAIYLIERGIPVITTDLPEFLELKRKGGGLITVSRNVNCLLTAIEELMDSETKYDQLLLSNIDYCTKNSIATLIDNLL